MRVIAGQYRSRPLAAPAGDKTRPTSDRLREALFNVLRDQVEGARVVDLFAGSGAVGIEAISRGASRVDFVERAQPALKVLRANLASLGIRAGVHPVTVAAFLKKAEPGSIDLVFLDPPYDADEEYELALGGIGRLLAPGGLVVAEHRRKTPLAARYGRLVRKRMLEQGDAALSFYRQDEEDTVAAPETTPL